MADFTGRPLVNIEEPMLFYSELLRPTGRYSDEFLRGLFFESGAVPVVYTCIGEGGVQWAGEAVCSSAGGNAFIGSGVFTLGGAGTAAPAIPYAGAGGTVWSGTAQTVYILSYTASVGVAWAGTADCQGGGAYSFAGAGTVTFGGAGTAAVLYAYAGTGGAVYAGTAGENKTYTYLCDGAGGAEFGGASQASIAFSHRGAGSIIFAGRAFAPQGTGEWTIAAGAAKSGINADIYRATMQTQTAYPKITGAVEYSEIQGIAVKPEMEAA
jgi:hypothetical protein